jgi:TRAP transporter TAXI family solute receptor
MNRAADQVRRKGGNMMKFLVTTAVALALALPASAQQVVGLVTNPQGTLTYLMGIALAKLANEKAGVVMRHQPSGGTSQIMPQLDSGEFEFAMFSAIDMIDGYQGVGSYPGKPVKNLRAAAVIGQFYFSFFVRNDSPVHTLADTKGLRIPTEFPAARVVVRSTEAYLASANLTFADFVAQPVANLGQAVNEFRNGRVDLGLLPVGAGGTVDLNATVPGGIRYIPMPDSPEAVARMRRIVPVVYPSVVQPAPQYPGIRAATPVMTYDIYLAASAHAPDDLVYKIVKTMHENPDALVAAFAGFRDYRPQEAAKTFPVPYHPGAVRVYTEKGLWPPKK